MEYFTSQAIFLRPLKQVMIMYYNVLPVCLKCKYLQEKNKQTPFYPSMLGPVYVRGNYCLWMLELYTDPDQAVRGNPTVAQVTAEKSVLNEKMFKYIMFLIHLKAIFLKAICK